MVGCALAAVPCCCAWRTDERVEMVRMRKDGAERQTGGGGGTPAPIVCVGRGPYPKLLVRIVASTTGYYAPRFPGVRVVLTQ